MRSYDDIHYKCAADQMLLAAGVTLLFHARAAAVLMDGQRILSLVVETKSGRQAIRANVVVDCSGDADVAHSLGFPYQVGWARKRALPIHHVSLDMWCRTRAAAVGEFKPSTISWPAPKAEYPAATGSTRRCHPPSADKTSEWRANVTQIANADGAL